MATYLLVNCIFLLVVIILFPVRIKKPSKAILFTLLGLLVLTAIFDSLIVNFEIVGYNTSHILGVYVGAAPIEDFFYALLAVMIVPTLWRIMGKKHDRKD